MIGFQTLFYKEILRFWKVATQTLTAPIVTAHRPGVATVESSGAWARLGEASMTDLLGRVFRGLLRPHGGRPSEAVVGQPY